MGCEKAQKAQIKTQDWLFKYFLRLLRLFVAAKPEIVVFDLGKVLVDFDYSIAARKIAGRSTKATRDLHSFLGSSPLLVQFETGRLTRIDFFEEIRKITGFLGDVREFGDFFADIFIPIPAMVSLHRELRWHGHPTYIFSNTNDLAIEHIRRRFPFFRNFDGYVFSYEVGSMKPEDKIYKAVEKMTGRQGQKIVYLDDRPENIGTATGRGWRTILHETPEKSRAALKEMGLLA